MQPEQTQQTRMVGRWIVVFGCLLTVAHLGSMVVTHTPATALDVLLVVLASFGLVLVIRQATLLPKQP